ncbi:YcxB family protein [Actinoplanes sp. NPDC049265]|uniref:YcxB family protein n=1 Tax=Actinoplanes sp. NPDC049265 TaxID=3363902 RepID=UPI00372009BE
MRILIEVRYDAERVRRTVTHLLAPQFKLVRVLGGVLVVLGAPLIWLEPTGPFGYAALILGVFFLVAMRPITVRRTIGMQPAASRHNYRMTIDDEGVASSFPLFENRYRWPMVQQIVETPEVWYLMMGRVQAVVVPKESMTPDQRTEFAAFLATLGPGLSSVTGS